MPRSTNDTPRLRAAPSGPPFHVVLVEPEIPPNTGSVARLCAATGSPLHLVGRLGFRIDEHAVRRAGVDYWHLVDVRRHEDFAAFLSAFRSESPSGGLHLFTAIGARGHTEVAFGRGDALVFGKESTGLDQALLDAHPGAAVGIATLGPVRSLNLANAVGIALYEALRQVGALDGARVGPGGDGDGGDGG